MSDHTVNSESESKTSSPQQEEELSHSDSTLEIHPPPTPPTEEVSGESVKDTEASSSSPTLASVSVGDDEAATAPVRSPPQEKLNNLKGMIKTVVFCFFSRLSTESVKMTRREAE